MADLEKLARDHAYWADEVRRLKRLGADEFECCPGGEKNCLTLVFQEASDVVLEEGPDSFEEVYVEMVAEGKVCEHCQAVRRYRAERMEASRRLGSIRAALTRVGRGLNLKEQAE